MKSDLISNRPRFVFLLINLLFYYVWLRLFVTHSRITGAQDERHSCKACGSKSYVICTKCRIVCLERKKNLFKCFMNINTCFITELVKHQMFIFDLVFLNVGISIMKSLKRPESVKLQHFHPPLPRRFFIFISFWRI